MYKAASSNSADKYIEAQTECLKTGTRQDHSKDVVALLPWGDVWEDFYGTIGVSFEFFCERFIGSWQFGLVSALRSINICTTIYYSTNLVSQVVRVPHKPSGATICMIPTPSPYRKLYARMVHPHHTWGYLGPIEELFGEVGSKRYLFEAARHVAPYLAASPRRFRAELKRDRCRAIICQDYEGPQFDKAVAISKLMGLPVYGIFQGGVMDWNRIGRALRPRTMKLASGFIIGPRVEIDRVTSTYGIHPEKVHRIFNVVADDYWVETDKREARKALGVNPEMTVVAWHGRVEMYAKGLDILLDAWEQVTENGQNQECQLMLLGAGTDGDLLRERVARLRHCNVIWLDQFVHDRSRIRQFLAAADIYAFPSRWEGLPVAPTEAMAMGLPVVASNASGVRDIFEDGERSGGIVVKPGHSPPFARALKRAIEDRSLRNELGKRAQETARRQSTVEVIGRQLGTMLKLGHHGERRD